MKKIKEKKAKKGAWRANTAVNVGFLVLVNLAVYGFALLFLIPAFQNRYAVEYHAPLNLELPPSRPPAHPPLDIFDYNQRMEALAGYASTSLAMILASTTASSSTGTFSQSFFLATSTLPLWPPVTPYPYGDALLPFNRIVAYYGNFYSKSMGVLGEYPPDEMIQRLMTEVSGWKQADPQTPVIPAIDYIAVTAQGSPGDDGKYRLRMPASQIDKALALARQVHGILFLDVQVGLSDLKTEIPLLEPYLKLPDVHLSIDPEFSMKTGARPGTVIGTMDAVDVNYAADYLADLVDKYDLPPKILVVHRFTERMVSNYQNIHPEKQVQVVIDMDGWGYTEQKIKVYDSVVYYEPVQFGGIKLFYKNDLRAPSTGLLSKDQVLRLAPKPIYIQYQ